ncbi:MAG: hypothetical protein Ct9H90mP6_06990 [Gammaproteobacteria bacterium]|nr:MAG: hypothetical protein Ct9H90mP6_06990 [Gammaproteobacteria bacterium]
MYSGNRPKKNAFGNLWHNLVVILINCRLRIELNAARLTLDAAHKMDTVGNKVAASEMPN